MTVGPTHSKEEVGPGLLLKIIKVAKLSKEEFLESVEKS
jgi:predicted RNA binding protein YcfA (HicA-like mRNA interferase family)